MDVKFRRSIILCSVAAVSIAACGRGYTSRYGSGLLGGGSGTPPCVQPLSSAYGNAVLADNPGDYYRFTETNIGQNAANLGNSGGHGQYAGGITFGVQHPPDADTGDSAITLDGSSGVIGLTPVVTDITNGFTSEIWFKTTSAATAGGLPDVSNPLLEDSQAGTTGLSGVDGGQVSFCRYDGVTWQCITSVHFFNDGAWHLSTCTHDSISGAMNLYVDGQLEATGNATYGVAGGSIDRIGQDYNGGPGNFFSGSIDEVAVYPSVLSLARIQAHYAARGTFCP